MIVPIKGRRCFLIIGLGYLVGFRSRVEVVFDILPNIWDTRNLHDSRYIIPWELWYYKLPRSCRIISIHRRSNPKP